MSSLIPSYSLCCLKDKFNWCTDGHRSSIAEYLRHTPYFRLHALVPLPLKFISRERPCFCLWSWLSLHTGWLNGLNSHIWLLLTEAGFHILLFFFLFFLSHPLPLALVRFCYRVALSEAVRFRKERGCEVHSSGWSRDSSVKTVWPPSWENSNLNPFQGHAPSNSATVP